MSHNPSDTDCFDSLMEQWSKQRERISTLERERAELVEALRRMIAEADSWHEWDTTKDAVALLSRLSAERPAP